MSMARLPSLLSVLLVPLVVSAQVTRDQAVVPPPPTNALQGAWDRHLNLANAAQWEQTNARMPGQAAAQWNWFQSTYAASISRNNGALLPADRQELDAIADTLRTSAPNSFEQHLAEYYLSFPAPGAFQELDAAHRSAPERPELLSPMLTKALLDHDPAAVRSWSLALESRGAIAPALMAAARDVLLCLPADAVLFTNGDMDTQPVLIGQQHDQGHAGLLVVDRRLLADSAYRTRIWKQLGRPGAVPPNGPAFAQALVAEPRTSGPPVPPGARAGKGARPVYFAMGIDRSWLEAVPGRLHAVGAVFRVGMPAADDAQALAHNWATMAKPLHAGPLSRNYLLPGSLLLQQLRQQGRTSEAAKVEQDLRRMAAATGMEPELRQMGILQP